MPPAMPPDWLASPDINLDDAVITLDAEGRVVALNEEAVRLGLDGDPHGQPLEASFPIRDEFSGRAPVGLTRSVVLPTQGGELRAFDLLVVPLGRERGWTVVLRPAIASGDVEHEAWANLSKASKEGTALGDPATGSIGLVSRTFAALHGYTPEELLGAPVGLLFPGDGDAMREMEARLRAGTVSWESRHLRKDGTVFPVVLSVTTVRDPLGQARFRAMRVEDISDRKRAEAALAEREREYQSLFEMIEEGFAVVEVLFDPEGRPSDWIMLDANPAFERHVGIPPYVGRRARDVMPDMEQAWFDFFGHTALTGERGRRVDLLAPTGRRFRADVYRLGDEGSRRVAALFSDVTGPDGSRPPAPAPEPTSYHFPKPEMAPPNTPAPTPTPTPADESPSRASK